MGTVAGIVVFLVVIALGVGSWVVKGIESDCDFRGIHFDDDGYGSGW